MFHQHGFKWSQKHRVEERSALMIPVAKRQRAASNNQPKTRMNVTLTTKVAVKHPRISTEETQTQPTSRSAGCKWSSENWSCAYDSTFMIFLYIYRSASHTWKTSWRAGCGNREQLGVLFEKLLSSNTNLFSQQLFDACRDKFRDLLNAHDPNTFPRFGPHLTSASAIMEYMCPEPHLHIRTVVESNVYTDEIGSQSPLRLPSYCGPLHWLDVPNPLLSLQVWFELWFSYQTDRLNERRNHNTFGSRADIILTNPPPLLFFELGSGQHVTVIPSDALDFPCQNGTVRYRLKGIVYCGRAHFTARLITDDVTLTYDGQVHDGQPHVEDISINLLDVRELDGREAHICVYVFQDTPSGEYSPNSSLYYIDLTLPSSQLIP
ncbi:hypothetical protein BD769DRAFT_1391473 [Suillus cothurnatus]|nr:hypothetical protein BD769DRAFT_1391473 [Suillus cothurnatus]